MELETASRGLPDGLTALREELGLVDVMRLIERTARWVAPETFALLPVWFPEHARRLHFYKSGWTELLTNTNRETKQSEHKREIGSEARLPVDRQEFMSRRDRGLET